jgi:hypothetical protein
MRVGGGGPSNAFRRLIKMAGGKIEQNMAFQAGSGCPRRGR